MDKQEKIINKIDELLTELKTGREERSASLGAHSVRPTKLSIFSRSLIILLFIASVLGAGLWYVSGNTGKAESTVFIEQVHGLATLATAEAHVKVILEQEDNELFGEKIHFNIPGTKREMLLIVPATVTAGVDLQGIDQDDLKVDEEKKVVEIVLPQAKFIQEPSVKMDEVRTFSDEGIFRGKIEWDQGFNLAAIAQEEIKQEAIDAGILQKADKNAETVLKEFFGHLGYKVTINR
ncbi:MULTISPECIES: DUF4230 domain-containing protein [unclassified Bacillus (in: firmicutes)]|uniref:DUF4230 domain-containing protein n=1 Tax=unclassified Bacillus (in: firmicutes) TaxID=185979 RepID=UPI001BECDC70|nr:MULTISPECIES: DUF4230 domain-containing protein [unclassified Bacillus (in: firmicutes)]MBT2640532.1 DUF4230 domain-containing protein [Bacillus sp. ISL-39]MBT2663459.1 DUF4230 domain-containing protein [Bacillus sp. ISL-45]